MVIAVFIFEKKGEIRMRTKVYGEELTAETLENVTGGDFVSRPQTLRTIGLEQMVVEKKIPLW